MAWVEELLYHWLLALSRLLEPLRTGVEQVNALIRRQLNQVGLAFDLQGWVIMGLWVIVLFMLVRTLTGWARLVVLLCIVAGVLKIYGQLPG